jgi:hypothetical protein
LFSAANDDGPLSLEFYRLFLESTEFELDFTDPTSTYYWLQKCHNEDIMDLILESAQSYGFASWPLEAKFKLAMQIGEDCLRPSAFLKCVGLQSTDPKLASLTTNDGTTVLHWVARRFLDIADQGSPESLEDWILFGINVIRNGGDPSAVRGAGSRSL